MDNDKKNDDVENERIHITDAGTSVLLGKEKDQEQHDSLIEKENEEKRNDITENIANPNEESPEMATDSNTIHGEEESYILRAKNALEKDIESKIQRGKEDNNGGKVEMTNLFIETVTEQQELGLNIENDLSSTTNKNTCSCNTGKDLSDQGDSAKKATRSSVSKKFSRTSSKNSEVRELVLSEEEEKKLQRKVRLIFFILNVMGFLASFSYWMQSGVLPYLTRKLGVYSEVFGYMQSTYAFYQMIGSPIFGRCGDVFGCRAVMVVSELSAMLTYGLLSFASNVFMLFLSRVPALSQHNLQGSYMIITDISLPNERAKMLGILGVSHGLGMIVGSSVGGLLTEAIGEELTPLVAAAGNLVAAILVVIFIPSDTKAIRRQLSHLNPVETNENVPMASLLGLKEIIKVFNLPNIKYLLFVKVFSGFPFTLVYSFFSMAIMDYYGLGPRVNGIVLAYIGLLVIVTQGGLVGLVTKHFSDPYIIKNALFLNTVAFLFLVVTDHVIMLCAVFLPLVVGGTMAHIVITAAITKLVPIEDTGSALGLTLGLHGLIRTVAPTVGGLIFNYIGWPFFGVVGYTLSFFVSIYIVMLGNDEF